MLVKDETPAEILSCPSYPLGDVLSILSDVVLVRFLINQGKVRFLSLDLDILLVHLSGQR